MINPKLPLLRLGSHPIARGLKFDLPLNDNTILPFELVNKVRGALTGTATIGRGKLGPGISFSGANTNYIDFAEDNWNIVTGTEITMEGWVIINDTVGGQIFSKPHANGAHSSPFFSYAIQTTNAGGRVWVTTSGNSGGVTTSEVAMSVGVLYHVVGVYNGVNILFYLNGVQVASANATGTLTNFSGVPLRITSNGGASEVLNGTIFNSRMWNRALSSSEILTLYRDPWVIYQPKRRFFSLQPSETSTSTSTTSTSSSTSTTSTSSSTSRTTSTSTSTTSTSSSTSTSTSTTSTSTSRTTSTSTSSSTSTTSTSSSTSTSTSTTSTSSSTSTSRTTSTSTSTTSTSSSTSTSLTTSTSTTSTSSSTTTSSSTSTTSTSSSTSTTSTSTSSSTSRTTSTSTTTTGSSLIALGIAAPYFPYSKTLLKVKPSVPVINKMNPLTKGLVIDIPFFEKSGGPSNIITREKSTLVGSPTWITNTRGPALNLNGSTDYITFTGITLVPDEPFAMQVVFTATGDGSLFGVRQGDPIFSGNMTGIRINSGVPSFEHDYLADVVNNKATAVTNVTTGSIFSVIGQYDGINLTIWVNQSLEATTGGRNSLFLSTTNSWSIGRRSDFDAEYFTGTVLVARVWKDRVFTSGEVQQLSVNPFGIYVPSRRYFTLIGFDTTTSTSTTSTSTSTTTSTSRTTSTSTTSTSSSTSITTSTSRTTSTSTTSTSTSSSTSTSLTTSTSTTSTSTSTSTTSTSTSTTTTIQLEFNVEPFEDQGNIAMGEESSISVEE